jgi:hypothetical protein
MHLQLISHPRGMGEIRCMGPDDRRNVGCADNGAPSRRPRPCGNGLSPGRLWQVMIPAFVAAWESTEMTLPDLTSQHRACRTVQTAVPSVAIIAATVAQTSSCPSSHAAGENCPLPCSSHRRPREAETSDDNRGPPGRER